MTTETKIRISMVGARSVVCCTLYVGILNGIQKSIRGASFSAGEKVYNWPTIERGEAEVSHKEYIFPTVAQRLVKNVLLSFGILCSFDGLY